MTLDEYKNEIKNHVAAHNDFGVDVEKLFTYTDDAKLQEYLNKNVPLGEVALCCIFAGAKVNNKKGW